ncbi:MAG: hypothetical protein QOJ09_2922, partial [Actinomycetota bacterium]|nr:hypothetical protein [Actinomycetota bacterium]
YGMHMRTIYRDGWLCTAYEKSTAGQPNGLERMLGDNILRKGPIEYEGTEGELYNVTDDPHQWHNRWDDPACRSLRDELVADLYASLPTETRHLLVDAPA